MKDPLGVFLIIYGLWLVAFVLAMALQVVAC